MSSHVSTPPFPSPFFTTIQSPIPKLPNPSQSLPLNSINFSQITQMADQNSFTGVQSQRPPRSTTTQGGDFLRKLHEHAPNSGQLVGFLTLLISGAILLILTGLTITTTVLGLIFFTPLILISSPIWIPVGTVLFIAISGFLSVCGFGVGSVAVMSWMYRYVRGMHPVGSDRVDYARSRIADTASHMKDYAREYGGYLQSKVKDAAPGA